MTSLAAFLCLQGQYLFSEFVLPDADGKPSNLVISQATEKRNGGPKLSPKSFGTPPRRLEFDWVSAGYVESPVNPEQRDLRFRVYSQERKADGDTAHGVTRMLLRLWQTVRYDYALDHNGLYNGGLVDVYLCSEGTAGGEQRFDVDDQQNPPAKVNTIYIYDVASFKQPVEMAREIAHEYGHALLPPVGGFNRPEEWAGGYLGEKIFMRKFSKEMSANRLWPQDVMGAQKENMSAWVAKNVDAITDPISLKGPRLDLVKTTGPAAMNAYLGTALWMEEAFGPAVFARSAKLNGQANFKGYMESVLLATEEPERIQVNIPARLMGKPIYLPLGKAKILGGKVLFLKDGWAKVQPTGPMTVVNPPRGES